MALSIYM